MSEVWPFSQVTEASRWQRVHSIGIRSPMLFFELSQFEQQYGNVVAYDASQCIVIDAKISVNQPIARGDDESP